MSVSLRRFRAALYSYSDGGSDGVMESTYTPYDSGDDDGEWWCSRAQPTGRESTLVHAADHRVDAVFGFAAEVPVTEQWLIVCEGIQYLVRAVLVRDYGRDEVQVLAERTEDAFGI